MRVIIGLLGALALLVGIGFGLWSAATPALFPLADASAVQITQVYSIASYRALLSIASFLFVLIMLLAGDR